MATEIQTLPIPVKKHTVDSRGDHNNVMTPQASNKVLKDEWDHHFMEVENKAPKIVRGEKKVGQISQQQSRNENDEQISDSRDEAPIALLPQVSVSKTSLNWGDNRVHIHSFKTTKEFLELISQSLLPSKGRVKNDYMYFKKGIKPEWEDPMNKKGGKWQLTLPNRYRAENLDRMWLDTLFAIISIDAFGKNYHKICGFYLQRRQKEDRVSLWVNDRNDTDAIREIGLKWKDILKLSDKSQLTFLKHEDSGENGGQANRTSQYGNKKDWRNQQSSKLYTV
jgi:translation initiation factor 4E